MATCYILTSALEPRAEASGSPRPPSIRSSPRASSGYHGWWPPGSPCGEPAQYIWVTEQTLRFHLSNVHRKLEVENRAEASHYGHVDGLVSASEPAPGS